MRWVPGGGSRGDLKEGAGYLAVRARVWKAGEVSAGITGSVASAQCGGDEAGRRGPWVSGGAHCERAERATRGRAWDAGRRARLVSERQCVCGLSGVRAVRERAGSGAKARRGRGLWAS